ncbi:MAG: hypothetical protein HDR88_07025 [Bacteroides sp.]|nr:hypothetical protein [Bacteroides sp.]
MSENINNKGVFVADWFRVKIAETPNPKTLQSLEQALTAFEKFTESTPITFADITESLLSEWVSWLFFKGYTPSTVRLYFKNLSALFGKAVKEGVATDGGAFSVINAKLKNISLQEWSPDCYHKLRKLALTDWSDRPQLQLAKDLVLFAVYNGGLSFETLASYKKTDYEGFDNEVMEIVDRYSKPKNKYLFPLHQSEKTPAQLNRILSSLFADALKLVNIHLPSYDTLTAVRLWAIAALQTGFIPSEIADCLGSNAEINPMFSFAPRYGLTPEEKYDILLTVSQSISQDPYNWYAMQFRPHVNYDMVTRRLQETGITFRNSFYPMEEIVKRVGKKRITKSRPVVPGLLFFESKATDLPELFYHIGDLAWGYRLSKTEKSQYAVISRVDLEIYQRTIGTFTPETEIYPAGTLELQPGDIVEIIGGAFIGYKARFQKQFTIDKDTTPHSPQPIALPTSLTSTSSPLNPSSSSLNPQSAALNSQPSRIIYRLSLIGDNSLEWVVDMDPRLVAKTIYKYQVQQ